MTMRFFRDSKGSAAIEAAIVLPVYILFIFGVIEFGHMYWTSNSIQYAADEAARCNAISSTCDAKATAISRATGIALKNAEISATSTTACGNFTGTKVTITHAVSPLSKAVIPDIIAKFFSSGGSPTMSFTLVAQSCFPNP
jgi:Flp pilus assembly protein TadG